ncbi:MAG: Gfo/Idh/MocA family oxidoreductase, partial [Clostridiales bacterium]|nr:Gfo/Idh/MocA family oxidoreductase [Clostridiales bacterium]
YKELLKDDSIAAVDICTPNYLHSIIAVEALEKGKHVFCEKPDAVSVSEAQRMKAAAEKSGKVLMIMRNNRFLPVSQIAKEYIDNGNMGEIYAGRCGWIRRRGIPGKGGWFTTKEMSGGGPLIDLGVHMIDLAIWLMGNPTPVAVSGAAYTKFANSDLSDSENSKFGESKEDGTFDVEDLAMGFIRFDNGAVLQLEFSWASNIEKETRFVELRGTKAGLTLEPKKLRLYYEKNGKLLNRSFIKGDGGGHGQNIRNFVDVVLGEGKPVFEPQQGVDMIKILTAIYESAKTGREVVL